MNGQARTVDTAIACRMPNEIHVRGNATKLAALTAAAHAAITATRRQRFAPGAPCRRASVSEMPEVTRNVVTMAARAASQKASCSKSKRATRNSARSNEKW